jgi:hypothetical protein
MSLADMLAYPTMLSFRISRYMGSKTPMICFFKACWTEVHALYVCTSSSQRWRAALSWDAVPSVSAGAHPGACGVTQNVGDSAVGGAMLD